MRKTKKKLLMRCKELRYKELVEDSNLVVKTP